MRYLENLLILFLFMIPAYVFWRWLYQKLISDTRKRQLATWGSTLIITPILLRGAIGLLLIWIFYYPKTDFDQKEWHAHKETRYQMSQSMINNKMLIGKTKEEVKTLLGNDEDKGRGDDWHYYLGFVPGITIDPDILDVTFENGKVVKVGQHNG